MKKYFLYLLKKNLLLLACLTLFCLVLYVIPISVGDYSYWNNYKPWDEFRYAPDLYVSNISVALGIMSVLIPILLFSYKMNRRSTDMYYALPLSKTKILVANFLVGLVLLYASYSVAYWWGFVTVAVKVQRLYLVNYLYLYLASMIPAFINYAVTAFIYTRANTVIDGILSVIAALCVFVTAMAAVDQLCYHSDMYLYSISPANFFSFAPLMEVTEVFGDAVIYGRTRMWFSSSDWNYQTASDVNLLVSSVLWTLLAAGSTVGLMMTEKNCKSENCGQRSENVFCYKTLIPVYTVLLSILACSIGMDFVFLCAVAFGMFIAGVIYKRTIKIGWKFAVVLAACMIGGILVSTVSVAIFDSMRGVEYALLG